MGTTIEIIEAVPTNYSFSVKKQFWDDTTQTFVPVVLCKYHVSHFHYNDNAAIAWLEKTYGKPGVFKNGRYWDFSKGGNYIVMDEKIYTWFNLKWSKA